MGNLYKYGRTPHLPWSEKLGKDDRVLDSIDHFIGEDVVVTVKMDGENTSLYSQNIHARSLDSKHHPSRDWVKGLWGSISWMLDEQDRICGENMYAKHTIHYHNLESYFLVFSMWRENYCLSWDETVDRCQLLGLTYVPVLYRGIFDYDHIRNIYRSTHNGDPCEGYVVRLAGGYNYEDFSKSIGKYVSGNFVIGDTHWMYDKVIPNELKKNHVDH